MIDTEEVKLFFDELAPMWDAHMIIDDEIVATIMNNAGVREGASVLDVASGTGVLIPYYLARGVSSITAIDLSPRMTEIAEAKFADMPDVKVLCGDVETFYPDEGFDSIVVYNAFPHFPDPDRLIRHLTGLLKPGGFLTIAHGMSRDAVNAHHGPRCRGVTNGLMAAEELSSIFVKYLDVTTVISNDRMYQVAGRLV